ncbi:hypothetical protein NDU88_000666 [Pleurodeles waltl]|uniref:Uncharacterized protein n=1 Tax=Pleurodeles waltl TaxID=8319 RepID=A0AAV7NB46_PLEWA|nr:hypothetical protein NDU88_000666 [Pleurodeles waltl]
MLTKATMYISSKDITSSMPQDLSKVSLLAPVCLLEMQESGDESLFGPAYRPSQPNVKWQETEDEETEHDLPTYVEGNFSFTDRGRQSTQEYETFQEHYPYVEPEEEQLCVQDHSVTIPVSLVTDLRMMISDYYRRFPDTHAPAHQSPLTQDVQGQHLLQRILPQDRKETDLFCQVLLLGTAVSDDDQQPEEG